MDLESRKSSIQVTDDVKHELKSLALTKSETYNNIVVRLINYFKDKNRLFETVTETFEKGTIQMDFPLTNLGVLGETIRGMDIEEIKISSFKLSLHRLKSKQAFLRINKILSDGYKIENVRPDILAALTVVMKTAYVKRYEEYAEGLIDYVHKNVNENLQLDENDVNVLIHVSAENVRDLGLNDLLKVDDVYTKEDIINGIYLVYSNHECSENDAEFLDGFRDLDARKKIEWLS